MNSKINDECLSIDMNNLALIYLSLIYRIDLN